MGIPAVRRLIYLVIDFVDLFHHAIHHVLHLHHVAVDIGSINDGTAPFVTELGKGIQGFDALIIVNTYVLEFGPKQLNLFDQSCLISAIIPALNTYGNGPFTDVF